MQILPEPETAEPPTEPFRQFIVKIASRCNLNCSYCFVYNLADSGWQRQPRLMSEETAEQVAKRVAEHCVEHNLLKVSVVFHGGEPLIGGLGHLQMLTRTFQEAFERCPTKLSLGIQSNGLLFSEQIGEYLLAESVSIGISVDGPPEVNDRYRVDHAGQGSSARLEHSLQLLCDSYRESFAGFLCVIDVDTNPAAILNYLLRYEPPSIDFLLPLDNHDRRPKGKESLDAVPYGTWLVDAYEFWVQQYRGDCSIRYFTSLLHQMVGGQSLVESIGLSPVPIIVVETDGSIEGLDSLKGAFDGATVLGLNVFADSFDSAMQSTAVRSRQLGLGSVSAECQKCAIVDICGGGYLPHRYSNERGFDNPSVYCADLKTLISHVNSSVHSQLAQIRHHE